MGDERRAWTLTDFMPPSQYPPQNAGNVRDLTSDQIDVVWVWMRLGSRGTSDVGGVVAVA